MPDDAAEQLTKRLQADLERSARDAVKGLESLNVQQAQMMQHQLRCEACITLRDNLIEKLGAYATQLQRERDMLRSSQTTEADELSLTVRQAGDRVVNAKEELVRHMASVHCEVV